MTGRSGSPRWPTPGDPYVGFGANDQLAHHPLWGRLVKRSGLAGELDPQT